MSRAYRPVDRQLNSQRIVIVVLMVILAMAFSFTATTYAIYSRQARDRVTIRFGDPVNVYISVNDYSNYSYSNTERELFPEDMRVFPGSRIRLKFGVQVGKNQNGQGDPSSEAYIRVKFNASSEEGDLFEGKGDLIKFELKEYQKELLMQNWIPVYFDEELDEQDPGIWWVHKYNGLDENDNRAKIVDNGEYIPFFEFPEDENDFDSERIGGLLTVNTAIEKEFANTKIIMNFQVKAVQSTNVYDPLANLTPLLTENDEQVFVEVGNDNKTKQKILIPVWTNATWGAHDPE